LGALTDLPAIAGAKKRILNRWDAENRGKDILLLSASKPTVIERRFKMLRKTVTTVLIVVLVVCAGCEPHATQRKAAEGRWNKATSRMKLPLAERQYKSGNYQQATESIQQCLKVNPDNPQVQLLYGKILLASGQRSKASEQFELALKSDKKLAEGWYWLGVVAEESREYDRACEDYIEASLLKPSNVDYILAVVDVLVALNKSEQAVELLNAKMKAMPRNVSLKVATADLVLREGDTKRAIRLYERVALLVNDIGIVESLGYCYILDGQWDKAAEVFEKLLAEHNEDRSTQKHRNLTSHEEQRRKSLLRMLGICNMNARQYGRAASCYSKLAAEERENAQFWLQRGQAALGARAPRRAFMCAQMALTLRPGNSDAIALLGCAQYASGDYLGAVETLEKIAADGKNGGFSWLMRARCYEHLGMKSQADRAYEKAMEINPDSELGGFLAQGRGAENWPEDWP
jgi:tetratricopeptide (TPR) repeat protein